MLFIFSCVFFLSPVASVRAGGLIEDEPRISVEEIRKQYDSFGGLVLRAQSGHAESYSVYAVSETGAFSYRQYDRELFARIYREHRDAAAEWDEIPANFVYYDGGLSMLASASFDPAGMYDDIKLSAPLRLGEKIQVLSSVWPVVSSLMDRGTFELNEYNSWTLLVEDVNARVVFDERGAIREVVWGENGDKTALVGRWVYSGYGEGRFLNLPTNMVQSYKSADQSAENAVNSESHFNLEFDLDPVQVEKLLQFVDPAGEYSRRDYKTQNVYDSAGTLLYNEEKMTAEYLKALGKGNPKRNRWILLSVLGVAVVGSVWGLRRRVA